MTYRNAFNLAADLATVTREPVHVLRDPYSETADPYEYANERARLALFPDAEIVVTINPTEARRPV